MNAPESPALLAPPFVPGVYDDMPAPVYHRHEAMSASGAKKMLRSPQHFLLARTQPSEPTDTMNFGTSVHCAVLQPDLLPSVVVQAPSINRRTNAGKEEYAAFCTEHQGKVVLHANDYRAMQKCAENVRAHPAAKRLLAGARTEVSILWEDGKYKVPCKMRADALNLGGVIDLKTTTDASADAFARSIATYQYALQAAFYYSGCEHMLNETPEFFAFIVVENEEPHAVACYVLGSASILAGARQADMALERYANALRDGVWNGYDTTINTIDMPRWARTFA